MTEPHDGHESGVTCPGCPHTEPTPPVPAPDAGLTEAVAAGLRRCRVEDAPNPLIRESDIGHITHMVTEAVAGYVAAEVAHWKSHAEEAGLGFAQVCRDYARVSARNVELAERLEDATVAGEAVES